MKRERRIWLIFFWILIFVLSVQKGRVCPSTSSRLSCLPAAVSKKDKVLRCFWVFVQLPELHAHLPRWLHDILLDQQLWLLRNQLLTWQGECFNPKSPHSVCVGYTLYFFLFFYQGVCGWWYGSPSGEWVGRRVQEMQLHWPAGQRHSAPRGPVQTSRVWSELSSGEISANMSNKHHKYSHSTGNVHVWHVLQGSTYTPVKGECCGKCTQTSCVESAGDMRGDTLIGGKLRYVCPAKLDFFKVLLL